MKELLSKYIKENLEKLSRFSAKRILQADMCYSDDINTYINDNKDDAVKVDKIKNIYAFLGVNINILLVL